ncbi:divalent-cation tolerance protein CutA [Pseudomonadota bacterium]
MAENEYQLVLSTCSDAETANILAKTLVEENIAACVNVIENIRSTYRWQGTIESSQEQLLIIKINAANYAKVEKRLAELHPYELPEIIAVPITAGLPAYLSWIDSPA